ncbi:LysR family transcriptional regulator [Acidovorax sp. MR-S7]|uniref:LysR family transcriptional regulator n=1 Tax=Acidovorax sp. MR-S7 TaxID=1268622 RepID=UPI0003627BD3|nr:LysR substrate-binding domain-containing protein [Acidovorax sp. MR-S7]GAD22365.1 transcriptional regulator [Acidovorax sp. MR-S7]
MLSRNLLAFIAVAEELHFGRAAQRLHISQPPLSQQIRQFEEEVGAPLLVRTTRSVQLTPAGRLLLERAHLLVAEADAALHAVRRHALGDEGVLTLGFTHSTVYRVLPQVLQVFRQACPDVVLELRQQTSDLLVEDVRSGRLDVALLRFSASMDSAGLVSSVVSHDPMVLVLPLGHPLAAHERVPVRHLQGLPWVGYEPQGARYFHELEEKLLASAQVRPHVRHHSLLPTLLALVEAGMGAALVPLSAVQGGAGRFAWRELALPAGGAPLDAVLSCVWSADNCNPVVQRFLACLPQA